jgi:glycosyltransferase involved in cell wall biosynthesis
VSVVIATYNRLELLGRVLEPLLAEPDSLEVIVVVDGSSDGSMRWLRDLGALEPRLRPILIGNRGVGAARLAGVQEARGDVVLMLDDDVRLERGTVAGHARHHAAAPGLVVVGAMPVSGGPQRGPRDFPRAIYAAEYRRHCAGWRAEPWSVLPRLWGGHLSVARPDLLALEPPAPAELSRGYHSDIDFGLRCMRAGLRGVFDPGLRAEHLYARDPDAFVRDARSSGRSLSLVHQVHRDTLGPLAPDFAAAGLPWAAAALVRGGGSRGWPVQGLKLAVPALGRLHLYRAQRFTAGLRWRVEQQRAARELAQERRDADGPMLLAPSRPASAA